MDSKTKKITTTAMLCAIAYAVVVVGRIPVVLFLKYDPKDIIITLGGLIWGPMTSVVMELPDSTIYMGYPREAVAELLVPAFLPFNLLKAGLNAGFTFLLYKPIITALRKAGYISDSQNVQGRKPIGLWLFSGILVITCILLILSFNGTI